MTLECQRCKLMFEVGDDQAGLTARCGRCGTWTKVPAKPATVLPRLREPAPGELATALRDSELVEHSEHIVAAILGEDR